MPEPEGYVLRQHAPPRRVERCNSWCDYQGGAVCVHCGWAPATTTTLRVWDDATADYRSATQLDLDTMRLTVQAYHRLRDQVMAVHARLQDDVRVLRSRAGVAHPGEVTGGIAQVAGAVERAREVLAE